MKKILDISLRAITVLVVVVFTSVKVSAQAPPDGPGTSGSNIQANGNSPAPTTVPFDGGMSIILLASGIGYASKKVKNLKKEK